MIRSVLILDLDGVLITNSLWQPDEIDSDGYSKFDENCVTNLNLLLNEYNFEIWLSSARRTAKTLEEFNLIFKARNILEPIRGFLPVYPECSTRKDEIETFIKESNTSNFLIIDDDKSLHKIDLKYKNNLVLTELYKGFDKECLRLAIEKTRLLSPLDRIY